MRLSISSKSTWCPSNSGPSTHTNFVTPPTVILQAPHIPVPSTMIVLRDTSVGISYFFVSRHTNFIMMAGPITKHLSIFSFWIIFSMPSVIKPLLPYEPSSVIMTSSSEMARISFSSMINSLVLPARTVTTRLPAAFKAGAMGSMGATPTPPPAQMTVPNLAICVGFPSGPTTSAKQSPIFIAHSLSEETPTRCTTNVIVPFAVSASAMVKGIRSPCLSTRMMTKWPAFLLRAMAGALMTNLYTFSENCCLLKISFMVDEV